MTYITGTLTDSNSPQTLYNAIESALILAGFGAAPVDTVVVNTRTHKIWKCPAASNPANVDWYLDVAYTTVGAGTLGFYCMEHYDPVGHLAYRAPWYSTYAYAPETTYYSRHGGTGYSVENSNLGIYAGNGASGGNGGTNRDMSCPATSFGYWISITPKRVVAVNSQHPTVLWYAGLYAPYADYLANIGSPLMFPLISMYTEGGGTNYTASLSRYPKDGAAGYDWYRRLQISPTNAGNFPAVPSGATSYTAIRRAVPMTAVSYHSLFPAGRFGDLYDVGFINTSATVNRGDTLTIDGATWIFATPASNISPIMKAV